MTAAMMTILIVIMVNICDTSLTLIIKGNFVLKLVLALALLTSLFEIGNQPSQLDCVLSLSVY